MSELTKCNYCTLEDMRHRASKRGEYVELRQVPIGLEYWWSARYSDKEEPSAHFMQLTKGCVC